MVSLLYAEKSPKINQCLRNKYVWQRALSSQIINVKLSFNTAITFIKFTCKFCLFFLFVSEIKYGLGVLNTLFCFSSLYFPLYFPII